MADFDLTQTDAQVQSILNDAQDAQGAGAQTTLTTDYIMLKGTNGRYHKILKDSFTEAVRNVLSGLLVNNDKGTTISQIPAISSGDFGSVTPANLASVLGGLVYSTNIKEVTTVTDLNAQIGDSKSFIRLFVSVQSSPANLPDGVSSTRFFLEVCNMSSYYLIQKIYIVQSNNFAIYSRSKFGNNDWTNWKTIA